MTDREMLQAAAKAFWGDDIDDCCSIQWLEEDQAIGYTHADNQDHNGEDREFVWNPLTDDGDALRLSVKLRLEAVPVEGGGVDVVRWVNGVESIHVSESGVDKFAATRRAIVRAAAEIGQGMPRPTPAADLPEDNYYKTQAEAFGYGRAK